MPFIISLLQVHDVPLLQLIRSRKIIFCILLFQEHRAPRNMCFYYIITFVSLLQEEEALYDINVVLSCRDISFIISLFQEREASIQIIS